MLFNKRVKSFLLISLLSIGLGSMIGCDKSKTAKYKNIDAVQTEELIQKSNDKLILDVRSKEEFDKSHIKDAININYDNIKDNLGDIQGYKDEPVLIYCNTGNKSEKAAKILSKNGFTKVYNATDGIKEHNYELAE